MSSEPKTMTVVQGKCAIYPEKQERMCVRVKVLVMQLKPGDGPGGEWVADGEPLHSTELRCGDAGLRRLLKKVDDGTKPPTPRQKRLGLAEKET